MRDNPQTQHLLTRLDSQFQSLEHLLLGVDEETIDRPPTDGTWSAAQQLAHLARYHEISDARITRILEENDPVLIRYRAEQDEDWPGWTCLSPTVVIERLRQLRSSFVDRLEHLPAGSYARIGIHPTFGPMTLADWLEFFLVHEGHHMYAIFRRIHGSNP